MLEHIQRKEVNHLIGMLQGLFMHNNKEVPKELDALTSIPDFPSLREQGLTPRRAATAGEALAAISRL